MDHFFNEVNLISGIRHKNLVELLGCSITGPESLLVYEYVPNQSVHDNLFGGTVVCKMELKCSEVGARVMIFLTILFILCFDEFRYKECSTTVLGIKVQNHIGHSRGLGLSSRGIKFENHSQRYKTKQYSS